MVVLVVLKLLLKNIDGEGGRSSRVERDKQTNNQKMPGTWQAWAIFKKEYVDGKCSSVLGLTIGINTFLSFN